MTATLSDYRNPGVEINEKVAGTILTGTQFGVGGFTGTARRGDTTKHIDVATWEEWNSRFGGGAYRGYYRNASEISYMSYAIREFFRENKGQLARISRAVSATAAAATGTFRGVNGSSDSIKFTAKSKGAWGNKISVTTQKYEVLTTAQILTGAVEATLASVVDIELGDMVKITDGTTTGVVFVQEIDTSTKKIKFAALTLGATIASGATCTCATTHLCKTSLAANLVNGATSALLTDATGITIGSRVYIGTLGDAEVEVIVTGLTDNTISFSAVTLGAIIEKTNSVVASIEFSLYIQDEGEYVESFQGLSMSDTNETNWIEEVLNGSNNLSDYLILDDETYIKTKYESEDIPIINGATIVSAPTFVLGSDGSAVTESEIIGSSIGPKTGMYLLDGLEMDYLCAPGYNAGDVIKAGLGIAKARKDLVFIHSHPYASDSVEEIRNFKSKTLNYPTSYGAMYSPWLEIKDPTRTGKSIWTDPVGFVLAEAAYVARTFGLHYSPANTILSGDILNLSLALGDSDGTYLGILNHEGINMIRYFEGEGYKIYGARTESQLQNGFHWLAIRLYINWIKRSLRKFLNNYVIRPNMQTFRKEIQESINDFFEGEWELGHLYPEDDKADAFFVQCDSINNPRRLTDQGYLIIDAGVQPPPPAEFVTLNISLYKGGTVSIAESTVSAG